MDLERLVNRMAGMVGVEDDPIYDAPSRRGVTKKKYNFAKTKRSRVIARATRNARRKQSKKNNSLYSRKGKRK